MAYSFAQPHPYVQYPYVSSPYSVAAQYSGAGNQTFTELTQVPFMRPVQTELGSPSATHPCEVCTASQPAPEMMNAHSTQEAVVKSDPDESHPPAELQFQKNMKGDGVGKSAINIEDLMDADLAGGKLSSDCTLILTEGRAAMSLAVAGLSVMGTDLGLYGLYAVKRRPINACKVTLPEVEVTRDAEAKNIIEILGLRFDFSYEGSDELETLRYGKVLLMMDRDEDGSHMKGLIMNLFYKFWPSLLRGNNFLMQFNFPVVKAWFVCGNLANHVIPFYTVEDYEDWRGSEVVGSIRELTTRHYRSLESFTPEEMKEFFRNFRNNCVQFRYVGSEVPGDSEDHKALTLAFEKDREGSRRDWIRDTLRESFSHHEDLREMRYKDFVNMELLFYSDLQNLRSFPSAIDGLTRSERKVLHAYFKRHYEQEVGVLRLMGSVFDVSAYKQGMDSLGQTVVNMAQDFVGANNISILMPIGQFGTRMHGGKDAGKVKYLHTKANGIMKYIFSESDFPILDYRRENDLSIEPSHFLPVIPMILVNGSDGIGTGWKTKIPKYKPEDIIRNLYRMLDNLEPENMVPSFENYEGRIEVVNDNQFYSYGKISIRGPNQIRITELPIGVWTETYKEKVLNKMLGEHGDVLRFEEFHTDTTVNFLVTIRALHPQTIPEEDLYKKFYLRSTENSYFVAFDDGSAVQDYKNCTRLLKAYFKVRVRAYEARKTYMIGKLQFDLKTLEDLLQKVRYNHLGEYNFVNDARGIREKEIHSLEKDMKQTGEKLEQLRQKSPEDLWREDLEVLCSKLEITVVRPREVRDENLSDSDFIASMQNLSLIS